MSTGNNSETVSGSSEEDAGAGGKVVKISILAQLQRYRSPTATSSSARLPKIQHRTQPLKETTTIAPSTVPVKNIPVHSNNDAQRGDDGSISLSASSSIPNRDTNDFVENSNDCESISSAEQPNGESPAYLPVNDAECPSTSDDPTKSYRANIIRPINRDVVHQICSGQVIVTLSTAVKELVENSLDAGATKIDVRLVEYGSKTIEVSDNASGIEESNFEGLALKHHTSKIAQFEDLGHLSTFGFRGEALSSLCALANLTVITRHKDNDQKSGNKISYDYRGHITSRTRCARDFGTTVILNDLFHTLPVRHKEFIKNLKKEYHRMVNVLYGYCLVMDSVRFTCTNQVGNGVPQKVLAVPGYNSMKERIVTLFGSKQLTSLIEIKQPDTIPDDILAEFGLNESSLEIKYELQGYISKPNHGRSSNDRQFYFINSRPCDPVKISRVINEVYHTFSRQQNPFVCLNIKTDKQYVDVNVTPDKRTVYVQSEKILLAIVKAALVPLLTQAASSYNSINSLSSHVQPSLTFCGSSQSQSIDVESKFSVSSVDVESQRNDKRSDNFGGRFDPQYSTSTRKLPGSVISKSRDFINSFSKGPSSRQTSAVCSAFKRTRPNESTEGDSERKHFKLAGSLRKFEAGGKIVLGGNRDTSEHMEVQNEEFQCENAGDSNSNHNHETCDLTNEYEEVVYDDEIDDNEEFLSNRKSVSVSVNFQSHLFKEAVILYSKQDSSALSKNYARKFRAKISPEDNSVAEEELRKQLTKDMFSQMQIVGQFNLGFVVVKYGPDLFIVDQHASDEKYNYEDLEKSTVLNGQVLIRPMDLELPAISENIVMDNIEIFHKNGFDFIITPDEEPRKRVKLSKIPFSKNIEFGKSDVEELIFMLEDSSDGKCFFRPTKVREMFASRACRKSVMIGTALNEKEMRVIVDHMGKMDQPWNCPHGRPTIRHLINLNILPDLDLTRFNH